MERDRGGQTTPPRGPQRTPYWEAEKPVETRCGFVVLRLFERAGKLQVVGTAKGDDGKEKIAKVVTIDVPTLRGNEEAVALLLRACNADAPF